MVFQKMMFYLFSIMLIYSAIRVISAKNPVTAVLHLVLAFVSTSGLWILIQAEFLALTLVVVYVGAVMVLFLFVVMMLDINMDIIREGFIKYLPLGLLVGFLILIELILILAKKNGVFGQRAFSEVANQASHYSNTKELGQLLYTDYLYPFEIAAVILLVAMIAAISLTHRTAKKNNKSLPSSEQLKVKKENQIKLMTIKPHTSQNESLEQSADLEEKTL